MKTTIPKLRKMIRKVLIEHVGNEHHEQSGGSHRQEPDEGYVQDHADMYADSAEGFEGYVRFGMDYGYTEDQLGEWFDAAEDALFRSDRDSYEPELVNRGTIDIEGLEDDLESGNIDLQRNPYALD